MRAIRQNFVHLAMAAAVCIAARIALVGAYRIPSESMASTLLPGDFIVVEKVARTRRLLRNASRRPPGVAFHRGDILIFAWPANPAVTYIKRAVALGGDTVAMRKGVLLVNGFPVHEPYSSAQFTDRVSDLTDFLWQQEHLAHAGIDHIDYRATAEEWGPLIVPSGHYFTLGDNRGASFDSRHWGFVAESAVVGRAVAIYWSASMTAHSASANRRIRWNRAGLLDRRANVGGRERAGA